MIEPPTPQYEYDETGDVLDVYFGPKRPAWTIELTDHIMLSLDRQTEQVAALSFLDFSELIRPTPLGPRSFPLTGLADLPLAERFLVMKALTTPPVNAWLDVSAVQSLPDSPFAVMHLQMSLSQMLRPSPLRVAEVSTPYEIPKTSDEVPPPAGRQETEQIMANLPPEGLAELAQFIEFLRFKYRLAPPITAVSTPDQANQAANSDLEKDPILQMMGLAEVEPFAHEIDEIAYGPAHP